MIGFAVVVPSHELGGPLRVVTGERWPDPAVSSWRPARYYMRREEAERDAGRIGRRYGRPIVIDWREWTGSPPGPE